MLIEVLLATLPIMRFYSDHPPPNLLQDKIKEEKGERGNITMYRI